MQTGIYALQYANDRDSGAGILVIMPDGKLAGGDPSFTYTGEWRQQGEEITAVLHAKKHRLAMFASIFGPVEKLTIDGSGAIGGMGTTATSPIQLTATAREFPGIKINAMLTLLQTI